MYEMIRKAEERDLDRIEEILRQVHDIHSEGRPDIFVKGGVKYTRSDLGILLEDYNRPIFVYVDDDTDELMGYAFCVYEFSKETTSFHARKSMYIDDLCVDEKYRGKGIGEELFKFVCDLAKKRNCVGVTLRSWECNNGAASFYEKMGMKTLYTALELRLDLD